MLEMCSIRAEWTERKGYVSRWKAKFGPKLFFLPKKLGFLAQKRPNLTQNMHLWSFWAKYWPIWSFWCHAQSKKQCEQGASVVFWCVGTRTFAPSQHNKAVWPKTAIFDPEYAFLSTYRPSWLIWCRFGWLNGGCGARAVSRKTPIYFMRPF